MPDINVFEMPNTIETSKNLFPNEVVDNNTIYHGTCELYHKNIFENGFITGYTPFESGELERLIQILKKIKEDVEPKETDLHLRISKYLNRRATAPLNFTFSSYEALFYASEERKGGQIFMAVRDALLIIQKSNYELEAEEIELIIEFEERLNEVKKSRGAIYAVSVDDSIINQIEHQVAFNDVAGAFDAAMFNGTNIPIVNILGVIYFNCDFKPDYLLVKSSSLETKRRSTEDSKSLVFKLKKKKYLID